MLFRQLFDPETSTYTYLLGDEASREAVLIDPVREHLERDVKLIEELGLELVHSLETHVHADHVTAGGLLRERLGCRIGLARSAGVLTADLQLEDGDRVAFGSLGLEVRATPGHTSGCVTYVCHEAGMAFSGDALFVRGCGRTDFQQGDAETLYHSVHRRIFSLPDETLIFPGHDYRGLTVSTVWEEKRFNPRLGGPRSVADFVEIMAALDLAHPKRMDEAVPANMASGITTPEPASPSDAEPDRWAPVLRTASGIPVLEPGWLSDHPDGLRLVDVREHLEFCGPLGHIEGAELVPLAELMERARDWDRRQPVVTVCTYGTRSGKAALLLAEAGFARVASLHGGMTRWAEEGRPAAEVMGGRERQDAAVWLGMGI